MADCSNCKYYKARRSPARALSEHAGMITPGLGEALRRMHAKEQRDLEREDLEAAQCWQTGRLLFDIKPKVLEYCSYQGKTYVTSVKNDLRRKKLCQTSEPRLPESPRRCLDCHHCVRPTGDKTAAGVRFMMGYFHIDANMHDPAAIKAAQFEAAYDSNGVLPWPEPPQFLAWCSKYSPDRGPYSICAIRNDDERCPDWTPIQSGSQRAAGAGSGPAHGIEDIYLSPDDDWRWCGNAQYQFYGTTLYVKAFCAKSSKQKTLEYRLTDAPQNVPFTLLDEERQPRDVLVQWRPQNLIVRSGAHPPPGIHQLAPYERFQRLVKLVEGQPETVWHPNEDLPYRAYMFGGVLYIEGCGQQLQMTLSRLPAGEWVRPREQRFGQTLPIRVRVPTYSTALEPIVRTKDTPLEILLGWRMDGIVELEWIDA